MFIEGADSCVTSHRMYAELITPKGCFDSSVSGSLPSINLQIHHWPYTSTEKLALNILALFSASLLSYFALGILPLASCPHLILPSYTSLDFLFISVSIVSLLNDDTTMSQLWLLPLYFRRNLLSWSCLRPSWGHSALFHPALPTPWQNFHALQSLPKKYEKFIP